MSTPSTVFTELVTTTLRNTASEIADNMSDHNGLARKLKAKKKVVNLDGGSEIQVPLEYAENGTYQRYTGFDTLNTNASDVLTSAKYDWAQVAIHVVSSGRELRQNAGKSAMFNLAKTKKKNAYKSAANNFSIDLYSDGALTNQIGGLAHLIQSNGQGTVGGIDSATWTFWRNQYREISGTGTYTKDTIVGEFNAMWLLTARGADQTDLIVLSHDFYSLFEASQQQYMRYMKPAEGNPGFSTMMYKTAEVIFDDNTNFSTTAEKGYFLNTDYLYINQHKDAQWSADDEKKPTNQDAVIVPIYWMGNLVTSNRARQGLLLDAA